MMMRLLRAVGFEVVQCVLSVGVVLALFLAMGAMAQPAGVLPASDQEAMNLFGTLWKYGVEKNWAAAFGPALVLVVWALKKWDYKIPKVGPAIDKFLDQPFVSFLLPVVISALGGGVTALATGHTFVDALGSVFAAASSAITTYIGLKKVNEQFVAGETAAAGVTDKPSAIAQITKRLDD